jgi:GTPase Era involved in 16S rRNA processing
VARKTDLAEADGNLTQLRDAFPNDEIVEISALKHEHTTDLLQSLRRILARLRD